MILVSTVKAWSQEAQLRSVGLEIQGYPAGAIFSLRGDMSLSEHLTGNLRFGYNLARRSDLGEHDDERGGGFGGSLGARYFFNREYSKFFVGLRTDIWWMEIDWTTIDPDVNIGLPIRTGETDITVLQPLIEGGYAFIFSEDKWAVIPKISLGFEINIRTKGEEVGEGAISLIGVSIHRRF